MQAILNAIVKAFIVALPSLISTVSKKIAASVTTWNKNRKNKKAAKRLEDAKTKDEISDSFSDMP